MQLIPDQRGPVQLARTLGPLTLWGLGVGYVISGMYFGWNLGLEQGGTAGLAIATAFIIIFYTGFTFSYAELACAIPRAGGAFDYALRAFGRNIAFVAGMAQIIEFVFAPPAIAAAIGAYFHLFFAALPIDLIAVIVYVLFTALNISGVRAAAAFELIITGFAVLELLIFTGIALPHFKLAHLAQHAFPFGWKGVWASIPFAIWFFLGLEGVANVAEETVHPQKNISRGFGAALITLIILCVLVFISSIGVDGWESIVYPSPGAASSDSPLPLALAKITGNGGAWYHLLVTIGLMGLVASFHGIILAAGRAGFEMGRAGYLPAILGKIAPRVKTPANALIINMLIGIIALLSGNTGSIITISVFGALTLYIISLLAFFALRKKEPALKRPFRAFGYPWLPMLALVIAGISLVAMITLNGYLSLVYFVILILAFCWFRIFVKKTADERETLHS
jgi:ethanolamine permease